MTTHINHNFLSELNLFVNKDIHILKGLYFNYHQKNEELKRAKYILFMLNEELIKKEKNLIEEKKQEGLIF